MLVLMMLIDSEEDRSKFEIIYKSYRNLMFYIAKIILGSDADAEDAVQEAFLRIIDRNTLIGNLTCSISVTGNIAALTARVV